MSIYDSKIHYPKGTPFTYLIGWTELDVYYYGVKFAKDCHPSDLWTKYFTSSNEVKNFREFNGEPDLIRVDCVFDTAREAREYEDNFFRENNCVKDSKWLNLCRGGKEFYPTEESIKKVASANTGKKRTEEAKLKMSETRKGKPHTLEHIKKRADARRGKPLSAECRQKMSDAKKGKSKPQETILKYQETCRLKRLAKLQSVNDFI